MSRGERSLHSQIPLRRFIREIADGPFGSSLTSSHYSDSGARVVRLGNIGPARFKDGDAAFISMEYFNDLRRHEVKPGDLLIAGLGDENHSVGRACVAPNNLGPAIVKADCFRVRLDQSRLLHTYAAWALSSAVVSGQVLTLTRGSTRARINLEVARDIQLPVPPLEEQRRIADFLDAETARIDRLDRHDQKLLGLLGERRKAVIDHEVNAASRSLTKLFWKLSVLRDGTHQPPSRVDSGVPLLTARNVSGGELRLTDLDTHVSEEDAKLLEKSLRMMAGDVLLSVKGTIGACAVAPAGFPRSVLDRNVALLRPLPEYSSEWLSFVLRSTGLQDQMRISVTAAAQPGLPLGVIRELRVPDMPLTEQEGRVDRISARCQEIDQVIDRVKRKGSLLSERRQALINAAVTGQFDVSTASGRNVTDGVTAQP
ncbi:restriction endonuclease subunit S [Streptomyces anulatus]|uniref:restriction endonuclease subunit S n=1 Tax=Streptomyces anulatus TaxID=1892 RepID=UPI0034252D44